MRKPKCRDEKPPSEMGVWFIYGSNHVSAEILMDASMESAIGRPGRAGCMETAAHVDRVVRRGLRITGGTGPRMLTNLRVIKDCAALSCHCDETKSPSRNCPLSKFAHIAQSFFGSEFITTYLILSRYTKCPSFKRIIIHTLYPQLILIILNFKTMHIPQIDALVYKTIKFPIFTP